MLAALRIGLLGAIMLTAAEPPDIAGQRSGEDWTIVVLNRTTPGEITGTYNESSGSKPGTIQLKWSQVEGRFNGTWRDGEDRFGELSLRLVGDEIRGAQRTDPNSKIKNARPQLADLAWTRAAATPAQPRQAASVAPAQPLDLTRSYQTPASQFDRISSFPWRVVPRGSKTLCNETLDIVGMVVLWGEGNAKNGLVFPEKVDDIPVNRKFDTLYVYHATFFSSRDGAPVYHLTLQYANGTSSMTTICYGKNHVQGLVSAAERAKSAN